MNHVLLDTTIGGVWLQGEVALCDALLDESGSHVEYHVPGFGPRLVIKDKRAAGIEAYRAAITPEGLAKFPESFDFPSRVVITTQGAATIVELLDDSQMPPEHPFLWIAAGIEPSIPAWDYVWDAIAEADDGKISYIAIVNSNGST